MKVSSGLLILLIVIGLSRDGRAATTDGLNAEANRMNQLASSQGEPKIIAKISNDFKSFLGSDSTAVVTGLRNGTPITLTRTTAAPGTPPPTSTPGSTPSTPPATTTVPGSTPSTPPPTTTATTVITPPTGKMGYGNVYISLALAKQQLAQNGITQPTPQQLQAALTGGTITTGTGTTTGAPTSVPLKGVLTMRSQHMGWGQIAHELGSKLGPVVSSMKHANQTITTTTASSKPSGTTAGGSSAAKSSETGIVSASGKSHSNSSHVSGKKESDEGIVSASGSTGAQGHGYGKGIVTGSGRGAQTGVGLVSGQGQSSGNGKGHNK